MMKLFTKYNRINVVATIFIFLFGCAAFAVLLRYVIINQVDEDLKIEKNEIITYTNNYGTLPPLIKVYDQYTKYKKIAAPTLQKDVITTTEFYNDYEKETELLRTIEFEMNLKNVWYKISVSKSLEGTDDLIETIIGITIILILLILIVTFLINRIVLKRLWKPFYNTLHNMQRFNVNEADQFKFEPSNVTEFSLLNNTLKSAFDKAQHDYEILKEFTENAAHELQTPLAIIQSKLDILIQNENLTEKESLEIQGAYTALQGLVRLNQSLLLLAKIENKQFSEVNTIDLKDVISGKIIQFNEIWEDRNILVQSHLTSTVISTNKFLFEIMLNNFLSNATKYNIEHGTITIRLNGKLQISNTGPSQPLDERFMYKRFGKSNPSGQSHGLGLSIVYQICIVAGLNCTYTFEKPNIHHFSVTW